MFIGPYYIMDTSGLCLGPPNFEETQTAFTFVFPVKDEWMDVHQFKTAFTLLHVLIQDPDLKRK